MSIPSSQANTNSTNAKNTILSTNDQNFINAADLQILQATQLGKFEVLCVTYERINVKAIITYYQALGYKIYNPETYNQNQPAELFGFFWEEFWNSVIPFYDKRKPLRIIIGWFSPNP
jgi:hypothetical protein